MKAVDRALHVVGGFVLAVAVASFIIGELLNGMGCLAVAALAILMGSDD